MEVDDAVTKLQRWLFCYSVHDGTYWEASNVVDISYTKLRIFLQVKMQPVVDRTRNLIWYHSIIFLLFLHHSTLPPLFTVLSVYIFSLFRWKHICYYDNKMPCFRLEWVNQWSVYSLFINHTETQVCTIDDCTAVIFFNKMLCMVVRCGSYDHHLYALNYKDRCCAYKVSCGGSIYGSPAVDMVFLLIHSMHLP